MRMMILAGDYVRILIGSYEGELGEVKSFNGIKYIIKLLKKEIEVKLSEDEFKLIPKEEIEEKAIKVSCSDGSEKIIKDKDLRYGCNCLKNNRSFKGLYALGKYYAKNEYPDEYYSDYFTQQILKIKNFNRSAAQDISKIYKAFIKKSIKIKEIVASVDYICFMPSINNRNHIEQWGREICEFLSIQDISYIIRIPRNKKGKMKYYKLKLASERFKIINGAFQIKPNKLNLNGKVCLILDDVCTTGLQINELTNTLVNEGAKEIYALVIGRAKY